MTVYDKLAAWPRKAWLCLLAAGLGIGGLSLVLLLTVPRGPASGSRDLTARRPLPLAWRPQCPSFPRYDCLHGSPISPAACQAQGCCYEAGRCFRPVNFGYTADGPLVQAYKIMELPLRRLPSAPSRYGNDTTQLLLRVEFQTSRRLRIKIFDPRKVKYEVPQPPVPEEEDDARPRIYRVSHSAMYGLTVRRSDTETVLFDTSEGTLVFSDQFLELTTRLPSRHVFGGFQAGTTRTWTMFDYQGPGPKHPMYLCLETETGQAHGVMLYSSNLMELQFTAATPAMTFRTTGGILDFFLFLGPSPEDVIRQYTEAVGRPYMPPLWSLGFQLGYTGYLSESHLTWVLTSMRDRHIPQETVYLDTEVRENPEPPGFGKRLAESLRSRGQHLVIALRPQVPTSSASYSGARHRGALVNDSHGLQPVIGLINDAPVVFPDFGNPATQPWWRHQLGQLHSILPFDGLSLEHNEPTNHVAGSVQGCARNTLNFPPYVIRKGSERVVFEHTICMDSLHLWSVCEPETHYNLMHLYGTAMAEQTQRALEELFPGQRSHVVNHATFMGGGRHGGTLRKYNNATWEDLRESVTDLLLFSHQGFSYAGSTVCGYHGEADEELCLRWFQVGAFNPLFLSVKSSHTRDQDPSRFSKKFIRVVRQAILRRYQLLPYLYTLLHQSHTLGSTVVRPLFHEFPKDHVTYSLKRQFLWGPALLISPVLEKGAESVYAYFPSGVWYDLYTGEPLHSEGQWENLPAPLYLPGRPVHLHVRGGHVLPAYQRAHNTTAASHQGPLKLYVALNSSLQAEGTLYWDDGITENAYENGKYLLVTISANNGRVETQGQPAANLDTSTAYVQAVRVMGLPRRPLDIRIDSSYLLSPRQWLWNQTFRVLDIFSVLIPLTRRTLIEWTEE